MMRPLIAITVLAISGLLGSAMGGAQAGRLAGGTSADSAEVAAVVDRYHRALSDGDTTTALSLLADDVMILESGDVESRDEYRSHHLAADIAFARAVPSELGPVRVVIHGDAAWTVAITRTQGTYRGRPIDSQGAELMIVTREADRWTIRANHWSSHALRPSR